MLCSMQYTSEYRVAHWSNRIGWQELVVNRIGYVFECVFHSHVCATVCCAWFCLRFLIYFRGYVVTLQFGMLLERMPPKCWECTLYIYVAAMHLSMHRLWSPVFSFYYIVESLQKHSRQFSGCTNYVFHLTSDNVQRRLYSFISFGI